VEELGGLQLAGMGLCPPAIARPKMVSGKGTFHSLNRPIVCITPRKAVVEKRYSLSVGIFSSEGGGSAEGSDLGKVAARGRSPDELRFFLSHFPPPLHKLETDWAADCAEVILRRCPVCERDSIIGHGRRRKQAHDEHHDWIGIRRGRCPDCGKTFTFLPLLSLPYTHYSLLARCQALRRRWEEHCS